MLLFVYIIVLLQSLISVYRLSYGLAFSLAVRLLIPPCARVLPFDLSLNSFCIVILIALSLFKLVKSKGKLTESVLFPVKSLTIPLLVIGIFAPLAYIDQIKLMIQFVLTELVPYMIVLLVISKTNELDLLKKTMIYSYILVGVWGIVTYILQFNPWYFLFQYQFGGSELISDGESVIRGGLEGASTGHLSGPLPWGQLSLLICSYFILFPIKGHRIALLLVYILSMANVFLCGKRSILLPLLLLIGYVIYNKRKYVLKFFLLFIFIIPTFFLVKDKLTFLAPYMGNIESTIFFWDDKKAEKNDIKGSSASLRISQFIEANKLIEENPLIGLGYGFPQDYRKKVGVHPTMYGFENILFEVIVSSGYLGIFVWLIFFAKIFKFTLYRNVFKNKNKIRLFHFVYLTSIFLTGIQASFYLYLLICAIIYEDKRLEIINRITRQ